MLKSPKLTKFKKYHKQKVTRTALVLSHESAFLETFFIRASEPGRLSARQLEAMRRTARKVLKRTGKLWVPCFPQKPITAKPLEVRMGKGKGSTSYWAAGVQRGQALLKLSGVTHKVALRALQAASAKLPILTKLTLQ